ncbi:type VI secretion system ATPase TssH [Afifella sp. H1R]|uniref:type VI secretion system ATPase TssH n=1 Tax=Afifella sp. H1R TaxID=2908841 RepID=UPI001F2A62F4|nr:type VI secretion system ATPase TssH [Afifella sp. H1R]MCF1505965.1 type VI secretion system ATPase TssH [Afifella sp. H1R]
MSRISIDKIIEKLDSVCRASLERAAVIAAGSSNVTVDIPHWLSALLDEREVQELLDRNRVSVESARRELTSALDDLPRGDGQSLTLSPNLILWAREAFTLANLQYGRSRIASGDLLAALLDEPTLRAILRGAVPSLRALSSEALDAELLAARGDQEEARALPLAARAGTGDDFLALYTQDLTGAAREGRIDPVIGRERELRQVVDALMRRRQNNPILVGEAGVGKTAIAEALALEIVSGALPEQLADVRLLSLDLGLLQAGAGIKGEFERRLRGVIDAVKASPEPIILFIDEAHMLMGAGAQAGQGDAANLLKPALARGEFRTLAATTFSEYKRYIEKDAALTRRFQAVKVDEPDEGRAVAMLRGIADRFEAHHGVVIRHSALAAAVSLSARYIPDRQLPDKAISLIDTAAASVALGRHGPPDPIRAAEAEKQRLDAEHRWLSREPANTEASERLAAILARQSELEETIAEVERRYEAQRRLADDADRIEALLARSEPGRESGSGDGAPPRRAARNDDAIVALPLDGEQDHDALQAALADAERRIKEEAGADPLVPRVVDGETVAAVVARWTGIPVGKLLADEIATVRSLDERLKERIIGQDPALDRIAASMRSARAGLSDPRRPPAVFLLVGLSGTGKTETALALADLLYGGPQHMTTINMSEFKEEHKVSMLLGSPPGYVGYGEGGVLTEAVRRRPYGVLLLDEIDKAHPGVQDIFFQVFDKGVLRDGEGRDVDFKHTTILMTANSGAELLSQLAEDPDTMPTGDALEALIAGELKKHFKPAFLGRTTILPYLPLDEAALAKIVALQLEKIRVRVEERYGADLILSDSARKRLVSAARVSEMGARVIEAMIGRDLLPQISSLFLQSMLEGRRIRRVSVSHNDAAGFGLDPVYVEPEEEFAGSRDEPSKRAMPDAELGAPDVAKRRQASAS